MSGWHSCISIRLPNFETFLNPLMSILYRNVRFVLFTKTSKVDPVNFMLDHLHVMDFSDSYQEYQEHP